MKAQTSIEAGGRLINHDDMILANTAKRRALTACPGASCGSGRAPQWKVKLGRTCKEFCGALAQALAAWPA